MVVRVSRTSTARELSRRPLVVSALAYSPDGKKLVAGGHDGSLRMWDAGALVERGVAVESRAADRRPGAPGRVRAGRQVAGRRLVEADGTAVEPGRRRRRVARRAHRSRREDRLSADGRLLASASLDGTIRIHDLATHDSRVLRGHTDGVVGVESSRDGRHLLSWGWWDDRTIRVWDVASGQPVEVLHSTRYMMNAMLSQHDTAIVTGDEDGVVRLWPIGDARVLPSDAGLRRDLDEMTTATLVEGRLATP